MNSLVTTAIDYTNGPPHIGHTYEKVLADCYVRYLRSLGEPVTFLTGVDQHGQKVQQTAERQGLAPHQYAHDLGQTFRNLWEQMEIHYTTWVETTNPQHTQFVQARLTELFKKGLLYKAKHAGYFSIRQEQFLTEKERLDNGEFGPEWGEVVWIEEENWYFRLSKFKSWLHHFVLTNPHHILPAWKHPEWLHAVEANQGDLCISRPKTRLHWGIEIPFDPDYVTYVWFDALLNYLSFAPDQTKPALHVIGKDILIPAHGIYWLCMLKALNVPDSQMPTLAVHGWWVSPEGSEKISKSLGNSKNVTTYINTYGVSALRYYLLKEMTFGQDAQFLEERITEVYRSDLANTFGNLFQRVLTLLQKFRNGQSQPVNPANPTFDHYQAQNLTLLEDYHREMKKLNTAGALHALRQIGTHANTLIETVAPWKLLPEDPLLDTFFHHIGITLRQIGLGLSPFTPSAAQALLTQIHADHLTWVNTSSPTLLGKTPQIVFPRNTP